jgi:hypothetical protein
LKAKDGTATAKNVGESKPSATPIVHSKSRKPVTRQMLRDAEADGSLPTNVVAAPANLSPRSADRYRKTHVPMHDDQVISLSDSDADADPNEVINTNTISGITPPNTDDEEKAEEPSVPSTPPSAITTPTQAVTADEVDPELLVDYEESPLAGETSEAAGQEVPTETPMTVIDAIFTLENGTADPETLRKASAVIAAAGRRGDPLPIPRRERNSATVPAPFITPSVEAPSLSEPPQPQVITNVGPADGVDLQTLVPENLEHLMRRHDAALSRKRDREDCTPRSRESLLALKAWPLHEYREFLRLSRQPGRSVPNLDECPVILGVPPTQDGFP